VLATGAFQNSALSAEVTLPQSLSASIAHNMDKMTLLADITWTGWSSFEELRIRYANPLQPDSVTTESWQNTRRYSVGVDYRYNDTTTLRCGLAYDESPVPSAALRTPRVPDNNRRWISFGATYVIQKDITIDVGYSHLFISDTSISNTFESSQPALAATLNGTYEATVDILSTQIRWYH
jgi:long-chain fatty acid transport protein